jgi:hypothetical protein
MEKWLAVEHQSTVAVPHALINNNSSGFWHIAHALHAFSMQTATPKLLKLHAKPKLPKLHVLHV